MQNFIQAIHALVRVKFDYSEKACLFIYRSHLYSVNCNGEFHLVKKI